MTSTENFIALNTIIRKEIVRFTRIWPQTILPSIITMILYFIIFGKFIGSQIEDINDFSYMQFIVPGLVMMSVITNAYSNVVSSFFSTKFQKSVEELLISPTPNYIIIMGYCCGGVARGITVGLAMIATVILATTLGALLPILFKKLKWDPALMSGPFITSIVDIVSLLIYFRIATIIF